jgi:hypothetical protein
LLILFELGELFNKKVQGDIDTIVQTILKKYNLEDSIYDSPQVYVKVVNVVCRALREKKDYLNLKRYAISHFQVMKRKKMLDKIPDELLMILLRFVQQAALLTKDYKTAVTFQTIYSEQKERLRLYPEKYMYFDFRSKIMFFILSMATDNLKEGKPVLLSLNKVYASERRNITVYFLLRINLLTLNFINKDYVACIKLYSDLLQQYNEEVLKTEGLGLEMLLFIEIYGAICYYEQEDEDYTLYLLTKIKRKYFGPEKNNNTLDRQIKFVQILEKIIKNKSYLYSKKFENDTRRFIAFREYIPGEKEYISLNAWLDSKIAKGSYYESFLRSVKKLPL